MSLSVQERPANISMADHHGLLIGQEVSVVQTKHEKPAVAGAIGAFVTEISVIQGVVTELPHFTDDGRFVNYIHIDRGDQEPTYVVPQHPVTITEGMGRRAVELELHYTVTPLDMAAAA
jgi:hypothetical protein